MRLTNKQRMDLDTIMYFIPIQYKSIVIDDKDIIKFFEYSDRGFHKEYVTSIPTQGEQTGFYALLQGKRWRGIHIHMYEEGVLDGSSSYIELIEGMPRNVVEFLKKEMFKGYSSEVIEYSYNSITNNSYYGV